jgi:multidrug efflux pump subunit AcrB
VQVQNKLQQAMPLLPQEVQQQGVRVQSPRRTSFSLSAYIQRMEAITARISAIIWRQNSRIL